MADWMDCTESHGCPNVLVTKDDVDVVERKTEFSRFESCTCTDESGRSYTPGPRLGLVSPALLAEPLCAEMGAYGHTHTHTRTHAMGVSTRACERFAVASEAKLQAAGAV